MTQLLQSIATGLKQGKLAPYFGPETLRLEAANAALPLEPELLASFLAKRATVPARIRRNPNAAAQYIENFRYRKTLKKIMMEAYSIPTSPPSLYRLMAQLSLPLIVDTGYDQALQIALGEQHQDWIQIQGVSRAEVRDSWYRGFAADDTPLAQCEPLDCTTLLYKPWGGVRPEGHFIVSDSDFVEVLTEIDIQTPIPQAVVTRRSQCGFVFLGCRFNDQLSRTYARQIMKRSLGPHFAVLVRDNITRNEQRFLDEQEISVINRSLAEVAAELEILLAAEPDQVFNT